MYAVIQTGGKQYRVQPGDILQIEKLDGDVGAAVKFDQVLFASKANAENPQIFLGKPLLSGASVQGEIVGQGRGDKILIIKMKRRKQYRRTQGHRQFLTQVLVTGVDAGNGEKAALSSQDKDAKLAKFQSHLAPKGEAFHTPKSLLPKPAQTAQAAAPKKTTAPKKAAAAATGEEAAPKKAKAAPKAAAKKTTKK